MEFTAVQDEIVAQDADALVNAAETSHRMGSGVAGALRCGGSGPTTARGRRSGRLVFRQTLSRFHAIHSGMATHSNRIEAI